MLCFYVHSLANKKEACCILNNKSIINHITKTTILTGIIVTQLFTNISSKHTTTLSLKAHAATHTTSNELLQATIIPNTSYTVTMPLTDDNNFKELAISNLNTTTKQTQEPKIFGANNPAPNHNNHITKRGGIYNGPSGKETYYNLPMQGVINIMRKMGYSEEEYPYWIREDGVKMFGDYIMVAANLDIRPKGTILECSLGTAIVCDTGEFAKTNKTQLDIAVNWH